MIVDLTRVRWHVAPQGYEWITPERPGFHPDEYRPPFLCVKGQFDRPRLTDSYEIWPHKMPKLFYQFATTPPTQDGIIGFADRYGFLGHDVFINTGVPTRRVGDVTYYGPNILGEPFDIWQREIETFGLAYRCWRVLQGNDPGVMATLEKEIAASDGEVPSAVAWMTKTNDPVTGALHYLTTQGLRDRICGYLSWENNGSELCFLPRTLIGAIWLQFAQAVANGLWKDCKYCGEPFKPKNSLAEYCSGSHRQLAYQKRKAAKR